MERMGKKRPLRHDEMTEIRELMDMVKILTRIPHKRKMVEDKILEKYLVDFLKRKY